MQSEGGSTEANYEALKYLAEKMNSFSKASEKADDEVEEIADCLTKWNEAFIKLKSHEHITLCEQVAVAPGVVNSFMTLADTLLPELGQKVHWLKCFGELNRCLAMWSYTSPLMQQKLVEEGIVSGIINELKVYNDSPASEPLVFLTQIALSTLCNCLQPTCNIPHYYNTECDKVIQYYVNSTDSEIRVTSIFILSYLVCKLPADRHCLLKIQCQDLQIVIDMLESISSESTAISPIPFLKALQNAVTVKEENSLALLSQGILSTCLRALSIGDSSVKIEILLLVWKLALRSNNMEKIKVHSDMIHEIQALKECEDFNLSSTSTCVLWDINGEVKKDPEACIVFAQSCYQHGMYERSIDACKDILKEFESCGTGKMEKIKLILCKSLFRVFNKALDQLPVQISPSDYHARKKLSVSIEQATEIVNLLGHAHDNNYIDEEGCKYLDLCMIYLISSQNALKRCERCLLCLQNLKLSTKQGDRKSKATTQSKHYQGLQHSHVWPKAVFDAFSSGLPKTTSRRLFRLSGSSSLTRLKSPREISWFILCSNCEQCLGKIEEQFIRNFFKKIYDISSPSKTQESQTIVYGQWLYQFCISIFLRGVAVLSYSDLFKCCRNVDKFYQLFKMCREILNPGYVQRINSHKPPVHLIINPTMPTSEESHLFSTIHEVLVSPAFLAITTTKNLRRFFESPPALSLFIAHIGILNVIIDIESDIPSCDGHHINSEGGDYLVPNEDKRNLSIPPEVKHLFYEAAHQIEISKTTMSGKLVLCDSHWMKEVESPSTQNEQTFMIQQAKQMDLKGLHQRGVKPSQNPRKAKVMNFLPLGFKLKTSCGLLELPPGHSVLLHCEIRDSSSGYDKGNTVFLAVGDGSKKYPSEKPYAIYYQYEPGMYISVGMFLSADDLSVTDVLADDVPNEYAQKLCENPNFQENMHYTLMTVLYLTGFSTFKPFLAHASDKRLHLKCLSSRRCWYCEDRCDNCMKPATFGLAEKIENVVLKFCSEECKSFFYKNPKVLNLLPAIFEVNIIDGKVMVLPPPGHTILQSITDFIFDHEPEIMASRVVNISVGNGSAEFPMDRVYITYQHSTILRHTLSACFVSDNLSLSPLPVLPQESDVEVAKEFVNFLHSDKKVESMLQAVISEAGFTSLKEWFHYKVKELTIVETFSHCFITN